MNFRWRWAQQAAATSAIGVTLLSVTAVSSPAEAAASTGCKTSTSSAQNPVVVSMCATATKDDAGIDADVDFEHSATFAAGTCTVVAGIVDLRVQEVLYSQHIDCANAHSTGGHLAVHSEQHTVGRGCVNGADYSMLADVRTIGESGRETVIARSSVLLDAC